MATVDSPGAWIGYIIAAVTVIGSIWRDRRKTDVDESALVLGKWKELVEQHQADIRGIREEFASYKTTAMAEIEGLRSRLAETERKNAALEKRVGELETENAGLKRAIAQNSQSTAFQLGRVGTDLPADIQKIANKLP